MTPEEIRTWRPATSNEFIPAANAQKLSKTMEGLRNGACGPLAFVSPLGTGKTAAMRYLAMCMCCSTPSDSGEPCGSCEGCRSQTGRHSSDVHIYRHWELDCANTGLNKFSRLLAEALPIRQSLLVLDEFSGLLGNPSAQPNLLKFAEDYKGILMLAITTEPGEKIADIVTPAFADRFREVSLIAPTVDEMATFLAQKAEPWGVIADNPCLYRMLVLGARQSFRKCLRAMADAKAKGQLTLKTIQESLQLDDDWEEDFVDD